MALKDYKQKRDFKKTSEPSGKVKKGAGKLVFVVQKHQATRLHYDFRLELDGVLLSWAIPKGPSLNPKDKRLAVHVEDHPFDYKDFEGTIPEGNYGAGQVIVWDNGTYTYPGAKGEESIEKLHKGYAKGHMRIELFGKKLKGAFDLVSMKNSRNWLLMKVDDEYASNEDVTVDESSVLSTKELRAHDDDMPTDIKPMLATLADGPFDDRDWIYEIKWDGYRAVAEVRHGKVKLYSRNNLDFSKKYPVITDALMRLEMNAVLDGEIVALDKDGVSHFQSLQQHSIKEANLAFYIFDILYLDGRDLRDLPLIERKKILKSILPKRSIIKYSDHIEKKGKAFFNVAEKKGLEGIMAKKSSSRYVSRRSDDWLKIKTSKRQEAVIAGFTEPRGSRSKFGALVLGVYENGTLIYIGHTGGGFDDKSLAEVHLKLEKLVTDKSPFNPAPRTNMPVTWVKPQLVCEVKFAEWTGDGHMRQPIFLGLREDKKAASVIHEREKKVEEVKAEKNPKANAKERKRIVVALSNLDKIYFPKDGYTKGDIIAYYEKMSEYILPYMKDRPESLNRHPNGIDKPNFFQKNFEGDLPTYVRTAVIKSKDKETRYIVCDNKETLIYMANLGCIEMNPWNSRVKTMHKSDFLIIDLDPSGRPWSDLIKVANVTHKILDKACERNYVKTSGKRGLHIVVPLGGKHEHEEVKKLAYLLATFVNKELSEITSLERKPSNRKNKIYLDYLQNNFAQTLAAPYSVRPRDGATVSAPLMWKEVNDKLDPAKFTIKTMGKRLQKMGDIWKPVLTDEVDLKKSIKCISEEIKKGGGTIRS